MIPDAIFVFSAGIVPLRGGGWRVTTYEDSDAFGSLGGRDRVEATAILAKRYPGAYIVTTSREGNMTPSHAEIYSKELQALGVGRERIVCEENCHSTQTAVIEVLRLAKKRGWTRFMFVSSGFHIPRIRAFFDLEQSSTEVEFVASESVLAVAN